MCVHTRMIGVYVGARRDDRGENHGLRRGGDVNLRSSAYDRQTDLDHCGPLGLIASKQRKPTGVSRVLLTPFAPLFPLPTALGDLALRQAMCTHYGDVDGTSSRKGRPMCGCVPPRYRFRQT